MGGAYVSKPEADPVPVSPQGPGSDDAPPGWDEDWPLPWDVDTPSPVTPTFPGGPVPPGYDPEFSLIFTDDVATSAGDGEPASMLAYVADQTSQQTVDVDSGVSQTWSAAIDGVAVDLRETGGEYASSFSSGYSSSVYQTFWGADLTVEFDLSEASGGDTLTVTVASTFGGQDLSVSTELSVGLLMRVTVTVTNGEIASLATAASIAEESAAPFVNKLCECEYLAFGESWSYSPAEAVSGTDGAASTSFFDLTSNLGKTFYHGFGARSFDVEGDITVVYLVEWWKAGVKQTNITKTITEVETVFPWESATMFRIEANGDLTDLT